MRLIDRASYLSLYLKYDDHQHFHHDAPQEVGEKGVKECHYEVHDHQFVNILTHSILPTMRDFRRPL